ncbi:MAG: ABC transporter ATP-binding protein [Patescibacteria group bacterium]|nr:ABC transporter ATP-binding protein [Patescibacteria group bacterium]
MPNDLNLNKPAITFTNVGKIYPGNPEAALTSVSFEIRDGEFFCLVGPSGCGKSTILKIISGLDQQSSGQVSKPDAVAMVFQTGALLPWQSVYDNVALGLKAKNTPAKKTAEICTRYLEMVGLLPLAQKFPRELSGGQRQRVGLARALAVEPQVLLLDEPFSALDTVTTEELHKDLYKIWQQTKKTIVLVSHSIEEAVALADRVMLMKAGRIEQIFNITLPYPRREQEAAFMHDVQNIRRMFFK